MNNLSITGRKWKEFFLEDVVSINGGKRLTKADMELGDMPFIGASEMNNGITAFTCSTNDSLDSNVLGVNYNGSVGFSFYHPYKAIFSDDVKRVKWLDESHNNRYTLLFLSSMIGQQKCKFAYGYKFNAQRMKRQKILLPICADGTIDWQFMEEYMQLKERELLKPTIDKLCKQLIVNELVGGGSLRSNWKEFVFGDEFSIESTQSGIDKNKLIKEQGNIPYVTRTDVTNGIDMFICEQSSKYKVDEGNVITIGLDTQTVFYQPSPFYTGQNIQVIRHKELDRYNAQFLIVAIKKLVNKFSWGSYGATLTRLRKSKIYLPVDSNGNIDFQFMSSFMKQIETDILSTTLKTFKSRVVDNDLNISELGGVRWKNFLLRDLFPILVAGKSKGLNHIKKSDKGISYLGATNQNNGVLCFVEADNKTIQQGNCIAFIRNGEGSMGYSVYKAEKFVATSDMSIGYNQNLNKYTGLFITTIADRIRGKYNFGYKRSATRLAKEVLTLPSTIDGQPDWDFMEQYMRNIESKQILRYLSSIAKLA